MLPDYYLPRSEPFQHQREALEMGWDREAFAYLLEMGLGKSRVLIDNFCLLHERGDVEGLLIIAPKSVYTNWTRVDDENPGELQRWLWRHVSDTARTYTYRAGRARRDAREREEILDAISPGVRILAINAEALSSTMDANEMARRFLRAHRCMIVVDESTLIKNPKSQRTKACLKLAVLANYRRILTGSPSTGSLSDFWAQFEFLAPGRALLGYRLFSTFRARYCVLRDLVVAGRTIQTEVGPQNIEELAASVARHSYRRRKKDCLDLPPKVYERAEVELTDEQTKAYAELRRSAMTVIRDSEVTTQIVITQLTRMHQVICGHIRTDDGRLIMLKNNRMRVLEQLIEGTDEQIVIWAGYRPDAAAIVEFLKEKYGEGCVAEWHGGVTQANREAGETDFQAGRRRFMVATSAGAKGRTWTAAQLVIYYSNNHDLEMREQSEDRTHRIGTTGTVTYVDLVVPGTLDEKIIESLRRKYSIAHMAVNDGLEAWI